MPASLREYVAALKEIGELVEVEREVDWNLEMGAIARRCYETGAPAPLFTNIKDSDRKFRAVGAPMGVSRVQPLVRIALTLGLAADSSARDIIEALVAARDRSVPPVTLDTGPCKQNVLLGDDVRLDALPVPLLHDGDGGRYLNTLGMIIAQTPDGQWVSWSIARIMLLDSKRGTGAVVPFQHIGRVHEAWRKIGKDMPFALALGVEPLSLFSAASPLPERINEVDWVGGFTGEPVELVRCETVDLKVPASAEIVIEGHVSIRELALEGPFGEYGGYVHPEHPIPQPVYNVTAITHRDDAIFPFTCAGEPAEEDHTLWGVATAAEIVHQLRDKGFPIGTGWSPFASANGWLVVTVTDDWRTFEPDEQALCRRIGEVVYATKAGHPIKTVIVTEDDVDPSDLNELVWALDSRNDRGDRGQLRVERNFGWPMSPYIHPERSNYPRGWEATSLVWNCLPPAGTPPPRRTRFALNYPEALQQKVIANWESDGFASHRSR